MQNFVNYICEKKILKDKVIWVFLLNKNNELFYNGVEFS